MAAPDEFYITLPSNASMSVFPKNSQSDWSTILNPPMELDGEWEVGLSEMHIPKMWKNIAADNCTFYCDYQSVDKDIVRFVESAKRGTAGGDHLANTTHFFEILGTEVYTREMLIHRLFVFLSQMKFNKTTINGHLLDDNISIQYEQKFLGAPGIFDRTAVTLSIAKNWSLLFEFTGMNENWMTLCRLLSIDTATLYNPITKSLQMNIHDTMEGEQEEYEGLIRDGLFMRICCPDFDPSIGLVYTDRVMLTYKTLTKICRLPTGYYATHEQLIDALNKALPADCSTFLLFKQVGTKIKIISFNFKLYGITFHAGVLGEKLMAMLGLAKTNLAKLLPSMPASTNPALFSFVNGLYPIDLNRGCQGFYVYCDLIVPEHVGDTSAHLLRVLPVGNSKDELSVFKYSSSPFYKRLAVNYITKIHMLIKTDSDEVVKFLGGKTLCELHFRKMKARV
jgi:hypothetical protein